MKSLQPKKKKKKQQIYHSNLSNWNWSPGGSWVENFEINWIVTRIVCTTESNQFRGQNIYSRRIRGTLIGGDKVDNKNKKISINSVELVNEGIVASHRSFFFFLFILIDNSKFITKSKQRNKRNDSRPQHNWNRIKVLYNLIKKNQITTGKQKYEWLSWFLE